MTTRPTYEELERRLNLLEEQYGGLREAQRLQEEAGLPAHEPDLHYRAIIDNIQDGYYEVDLPGNLTFLNDSLCTIIGYPREELLGLNYRDFTLPKHVDRTFRTFNRIFVTGTPEQAHGWEIVRRDGSLRFVEGSASLIVDSDGKPTGFRGILRDVTERKRTEEELRRQRALLEEMVEERTAELRTANAQLLVDIAERRKAEAALAQSEKQLRVLSEQLLTAQENERKRLAQELHDGIGQSLSAIKFRLESALRQMDESMHAAHLESARAVIPVIQDAIEEVRRISMGLRPSTLDDLGILATVKWFCRQFQKTYGKIRVDQDVTLDERDVPEPLKIVIFRVLQEALNNVAKHSGAQCVHLSLDKTDDAIELVIRDNGVGFDPAIVLSPENAREGFGLAGMRERTELSGGLFAIEAGPGSGTVVRARWE